MKVSCLGELSVFCDTLCLNIEIRWFGFFLPPKHWYIKILLSKTGLLLSTEAKGKLCRGNSYMSKKFCGVLITRYSRTSGIRFSSGTPDLLWSLKEGTNQTSRSGPTFKSLIRNLFSCDLQSSLFIIIKYLFLVSFTSLLYALWAFMSLYLCKYNKIFCLLFPETPFSFLLCIPAEGHVTAWSLWILAP